MNHQHFSNCTNIYSMNIDEKIYSFSFQSLFRSDEDTTHEIKYQRNQSLLILLHKKIVQLPNCRSKIILTNVSRRNYPLDYSCEFYYNLDRLINLIVIQTAEYCTHHNINPLFSTPVLDEIAWFAISHFMNLHQQILTILKQTITYRHAKRLLE